MGWDGYRLGLGFIYGEKWPKGGDLPIEIHSCSSHPEGDLRPGMNFYLLKEMAYEPQSGFPSLPLHFVFHVEPAVGKE